MYSFPDLEPVCCSTSSSNCCFLTCIQISQEAGQVVWYSHFFQNFPLFVVIHTVKGFGIVNKAEIDVFSGSLLPLIRLKSVFHWPILHDFKDHYSKSSRCWNHPDTKTLGSTSSPSISPGTRLNLLSQVLRRQDLMGHLKNLVMEAIEAGK